MQRHVRLAGSALALALGGCGGGGGDIDPTEVEFGSTTFLFVVNPTINDINDRSTPSPGSARGGVRIEADDGTGDETGDLGLAVLAEVEPGERALAFDGSGIGADLGLSIGDGDLREVAVALDGDRAEVMSLAVFALGGALVEVTPDTPLADVEAALGRSNTIVFFEDGLYQGDLDFSGSNVTLFGAGRRGGQVILDGSITVGGSGNRIRGAVITGDLEISGSDGSMSFSRVEGQTQVSGSDSILLFNDFCGDVDIGGSNTAALDNTGLAPLDRLPDC
jgi:hypothetical protein